MSQPRPAGAAQPQVTLDNCDREPIHIPGLVQPHGALFAFDAQGLTRYASVNAGALLGVPVPAVGQRVAAGDFAGHAEVHALLAAAREDSEGQPHAGEAKLGTHIFDVIAHRTGALVVLEFELRPLARDDVGDFALKAHRAMDRLKRQADIESLLALATRAVREITGFDRVMAYRFLHDDSGEVVAEAKADELEAFQGRRYPASDIPAQARRLYVVNSLRLIADVQAVPVAVVAEADAAPLDMSHCVLRSVSPIHIEYLRNMGVGASMSISIVLNGRLWGLVACHHRSPLRVPYSIRMACDVLAQVLAANVQTLLAREEARQAAEATSLRARLIEAVLHSEDPASALAAMAEPLARAFGAHAVLVSEEAKLHVHGGVSPEAAARIVRWLSQPGAPRAELLQTHNVGQEWPTLAALCEPWCGMLALRYDEPGQGWLVLLRREQVETIRWGGKPEKHYDSGPLGPRLTPRGSFEVWKQEVRGTSLPWTAAEQALGRQLLDELVRAAANRMGEVNRARTELLAMLGHDLRDPLQSISMAARVLEKSSEGATDVGPRMGERIQSSSSRMARLIGQVLDASRLQSGLGLQMRFEPVDLTRLLDDLLDESRLAYPGVRIIHELPASLVAHVDADRMAQLFTNLVSNARHHGTVGEPVIVQLSQQGEHVVFEVSNNAPAIAEELVPHLFSAFKRQAGTHTRNRSGLGLGLHIAQAIATGHGGVISYTHAEPYVIFSARFPLQPT